MIRALILLGALSASAWPSAASAAPPQEVIAHYTTLAAQLERRDTQREAVSEMGTLRAWLGEAQVYLKQENDKELRFTLRRVEAQANLIQALLDRADAQRAAVEAAEAVKQKEREAMEMAEAAFRFEKELAALEKKSREQQEEAAP